MRPLYFVPLVVLGGALQLSGQASAQTYWRPADPMVTSPRPAVSMAVVSSRC